MRRMLFWTLLFALSLSLAERVLAVEQPSFHGKTIRFIIASSHGGGTDTAGRIVARFLPNYLPGNPKSIIQNMPGGGGTIANNYFASEVKGDGLTVMASGVSTIESFTRGGATVKYDPRRFKYIGGVARGGSVLMVRKQAQPRVTDRNAPKVVVGDTDGIRTWIPVTIWGAEYLGWNLRWIYGYQGGSELALALRQGEIDMWGTQSAKLINDLVRDGVVDLLCQQDDERRADFPNVPTFLEMLGAKRPSGVPWQAYLAWSGSSELDKLIYVPESTPDHLVKTLREAFQKAMNDPEVDKEGDKFFGDGWRPVSGKRMTDVVREHTAIPKEAKDFIFTMRKKYGLPVGEEK
jgi:tripartite-type tricarboxylate transporter receptor subunit TctC